MSDQCQEWGCKNPTSSTDPKRCLNCERNYNIAKKRPKPPDRVKQLEKEVETAEAELAAEKKKILGMSVYAETYSWEKVNEEISEFRAENRRLLAELAREREWRKRSDAAHDTVEMENGGLVAELAEAKKMLERSWYKDCLRAEAELRRYKEAEYYRKSLEGE